LNPLKINMEKISNFTAILVIYVLFVFYNLTTVFNPKEKPSFKEFQEINYLKKVIQRIISMGAFYLVFIFFGIITLIVFFTIIVFFLIFVKYKNK
jgi:hypothetical protein